MGPEAVEQLGQVVFNVLPNAHGECEDVFVNAVALSLNFGSDSSLSSALGETAVEGNFEWCCEALSVVAVPKLWKLAE